MTPHPTCRFEWCPQGCRISWSRCAAASSGCPIDRQDFGDLLAAMNAKFCYPFDVNRFEGRSFDNHGAIEDVATGSAAGPVGAYLVEHERAEPDTPIVINQSRFLGRPSQMTVRVTGTSGAITAVSVAGEIAFVATGRLGRPAPPST